jgi:hypothetical protein
LWRPRCCQLWPYRIKVEQKALHGRKIPAIATATAVVTFVRLALVGSQFAPNLSKSETYTVTATQSHKAKECE